jgi:hypothetical protein
MIERYPFRADIVRGSRAMKGWIGWTDHQQMDIDGQNGQVAVEVVVPSRRAIAPQSKGEGYEEEMYLIMDEVFPRPVDKPLAE